VQYETATTPLLPPLIVYACRLDIGDLVLFAAGVELDDETKAALAKDLIDEMDSTGKVEAWRAFGQ
jgi:hypothetical protein